MPKDPTTRDLSDKHEIWLAETFGGRRCAGSGNQFTNQTDVRQDGELHFAMAFDGKATRGKSMSISRGTWDKLEEQAYPLTPVLALRWCEPDNRLRPALDLVTIRATDLEGLVADSRRYYELLEQR